MSNIESTSSLFADLVDAIKKASDGLYESICKIFTSPDEDREEIERQREEALEKANEEADLEIIPFDVMLEKLKELDARPDPEMLRMAAMFWDEDARLLEKKMAARHREILRAVEAENARQAMKRRKMLHDDGSFPEWAR